MPFQFQTPFAQILKMCLNGLQQQIAAIFRLLKKEKSEKWDMLHATFVDTGQKERNNNLEVDLISEEIETGKLPHD